MALGLEFDWKGRGYRAHFEGYYNNVFEKRIEELMKNVDRPDSHPPNNYQTLPPQEPMPLRTNSFYSGDSPSTGEARLAEHEWRRRGHGVNTRLQNRGIGKRGRFEGYQRLAPYQVPSPLVQSENPNSVFPATTSSPHITTSEVSPSKGRRLSSGGPRLRLGHPSPNTAQRNLFHDGSTNLDNASGLPTLSAIHVPMSSSTAQSPSNITATSLSTSTTTCLPNSTATTATTPTTHTSSSTDSTNLTKDMNVQAGPSMIISINSAPSSKFTKRPNSFLADAENAPPPKTVRIAPFNRALPSSGASDSNQPEILSIAGGGSTTLCLPHPVPSVSVPPSKFPPGTKMNSIGGDGAFMACVPASCDGSFSPRAVRAHASNCKCADHIEAQFLYGPKDKTSGTKTDPLVIDSDEDEVQIVKDVPSTPAKNGQDNSTMSSPQKESEQNQRTQPLETPKQSETPLTSSRTPVSPRQRAKMSADFNTSNTVPLPPTSQPSTNEVIGPEVGLSLAKIASKVSNRMWLAQRAEGSGSSSSASSSSDFTPASPNPDVNAPFLANPQNFVEMLREVKKVRPYKRLRVTARNLFQASKSCNLEKVVALLVEGCIPNSQVESEKGRTALHAAASGGYMDIMAILRMVGGDLDVLDYDMRTPLFDAVENHKVKAVEYLIQAGASLRVKDKVSMTLLHLASRRGHTDLITVLLNTGQFDINQKDDGGWTAIMWAAEDKHVDTTKLLIEKGGSVHLRDLELNIPLHWASFAGSHDIALLLLNEHSDVNSLNKHSETPLHIAARENNYSSTQLFLSRGARIDIRNKDEMTALEVAYPLSQSQQLIESNKLLLLCQPRGRYRLLSCDISRGQENVAIPCVNEVDDEPCPEFHFVKESCEVGGAGIEWNINTMQGCSCEGDCRNGLTCQCARLSDNERIWYSQDGLLSNEIHKLDRPLIFECSRLCKCWSYCRNRVVQKGIQYPLQLFKTKRKGWGVRALAPIPQGTFLCEYTGELISDTEADLRNDDTFLFDLDCKESEHELYCIDAVKFGNVSRFINHSCEPNCIPTRIFVSHQDIRFPRIAFFSSKEIEMNEEISFNYGDRFWEVKKDEFFCECGTPSCNYRAPV